MPRLVIDINTADLDVARALIEATRHLNPVYKFGLTFIYIHGVAGIKALGLSGQQVMLDLKAVDTPNTVSTALRAVFDSIRPTLVTLYPDDSGRHVDAVRELVDKEGIGARLLMVTVLTTTGESRLADYQKTLEGEIFQAGHTTLKGLVLGRACVAKKYGAHGIVCSVRELGMIRTNLSWPGMASATPGIRFQWATWVKSGDDQARTATLRQAIQAKAGYVVIGRPISGALNVREAATLISTQLN